ncbi:hypothetical protein F4814DRAFT_254791 [Daldinia grandis]|nr:hypothetical protein F4814DRAFT_254791 [Daldinia grandis]
MQLACSSATLTRRLHGIGQAGSVLRAGCESRFDDLIFLYTFPPLLLDFPGFICLPPSFISMRFRHPGWRGGFPPFFPFYFYFLFLFFIFIIYFGPRFCFYFVPLFYISFHVNRQCIIGGGHRIDLLDRAASFLAGEFPYSRVGTGNKNGRGRETVSLVFLGSVRWIVFLSNLGNY